MWELIDKSITASSQDIANAGKYDDAIFAAFRVVEATVQERIGSTSIGEGLIAEAFDGDLPKVFISKDARDRQGIRDLFSGALKNIRNDRGHKKAPFTPCQSLTDCLLYLSFATFLLHLLRKDKNIFPRIDNVRVFGTSEQPRAELRGANFSGSQITVAAEQQHVTVVRQTPTVLEVLLPQNFFGSLTVTVDGNQSGEIFCDVSFFGKQPISYTEVVASEIPLYSDAGARNRRSDVVGLLTRSVQGARDARSISPTYPNRCAAGPYITYGPFVSAPGVGESWYIDPRTNQIEYAWTQALISTPEVVGHVGKFKLGGMSILPRSVKTQIGENRALRVLGWERDSLAQREVDLTDRVKWINVDSRVAFVNKGIVIPKRLGSVRVECELEGFVGSVEVNVEQLVRGQKTVFFQGLRRLQQIRFDRADKMFIADQSASVYTLDKSGNFEEAVRLSRSDRTPSNIDCLAVDDTGGLYVNDLSRHAAFKFHWDGKAFVNPIEIGTVVKGPKKSFAIAPSGDVFIAVMGPPGQGWIIRRSKEGNESFFPSSGMAIWLAVGPDGNVYVPDVARSTIVVYQPDGAPKLEIPYNLRDSPADIAIDAEGTIYLAFFKTGRILKIFYHAPLWRTEFFPDSFGIPGGIAVDSQKRVYVSDFEGDSISVVY